MSAQSVDAYLLFGRLAVKFGLLAPDALRQVVEKQVQLGAQDKKFTIGEVAVRLNLMKDEDRKKILQSQGSSPVKQEGSYFGYLALVNGFVKQKQLALALKKQEESGADRELLGDIFKNDKLMSDGQVAAILAAQARIRKRIASQTSTSTPKEDSAAAAAAAGGGKAAEALARLAQFEKQFGGMVEVSLMEEEAAAAAAEPIEAAPAAPGGGGLLPPPPKGIYSTLASGELDVVWGEQAPLSQEDEARFAEPAPADDNALVLNADEDSGFGSWGNDEDVQVEVAVAGAPRPANDNAINIDDDEDVEVSVGVGGDLPSIDAPLKGATTTRPAPGASGLGAPSPAGKTESSPIVIENPARSKSRQLKIEGLVTAGEGERFKGRRAEQPTVTAVRKKSNLGFYLFIGAVAAIGVAYLLSMMLLA